MGDWADAMINGELCHGCGVSLPPWKSHGKVIDPPGFPRYCHDCKKEIKATERKKKKEAEDENCNR